MDECTVLPAKSCNEVPSYSGTSPRSRTATHPVGTRGPFSDASDNEDRTTLIPENELRNCARAQDWVTAIAIANDGRKFCHRDQREGASTALPTCTISYKNNL